MIYNYFKNFQKGLLQQVPSTILYMTIFEKAKHFLSLYEFNSSYIPGVAGGTARVVGIN